MNFKKLEKEVEKAFINKTDKQLTKWCVRSAKKLGFNDLVEMKAILKLAGATEERDGYLYDEHGKLLYIPGRFTARKLYPLTIYRLLEEL